MDSTTGGDANDEFARWLAETARAEQAAAPAPAQPVAPAPVAQPAAPSAAQPAAPVAPSAPEFFGADQLAAPPTRPYEPQAGGPPVARTSYQAPSTAPAANDYVTPTVLPPSAPAAQAEPAPPSWAPGYTAPGSAAAAAQPATPYDAPPAGPTAPGPTAAAGGAPSSEAETSAATPFFPPAPQSPATPPAAAYVAPASPPPAEGPAPTFDPSAYQRPAADVPAFVAPAYEPAPAYVPPADVPPAYAAPAAEAPAYPAPPASMPANEAPAASPRPASTPPASPVTTPGFPASPEQSAPLSEAPPADPFGALFTTDPPVDDTAARLAASPPPSLVPPGSGDVPADEDPLKSLFGLETEEQPTIAPEHVAVSTPLPTYTPEPPATAVYVPEPAFAAAPAPTLEPALATSGSTASGTSSYALTSPAAPPADDDPNAGTQFFGGGVGDWEEPPDLDRTTVGEKVGLGLSIVLPPIGLIAGIVNAVQSSRERGWVHRIVRISLVLALILSVVAGFAGTYLYRVVDDARKHDALQAASAQFCSTVAADPSMIVPPAFGFPGPGPSIPDTLTSIQAYIDKWTALAKVSPSGIRTDVNRVADAASGIFDSITQSRIIDNEANIATMSSVAASTNIVGWADAYCG
ncbi:MAG TPA: hypothetical protein VGO65_05045 [Pseudolysinimonas sp.]|nr:hypothetical protein [Pseudolysinimonas sp.]